MGRFVLSLWIIGNILLWLLLLRLAVVVAISDRGLLRGERIWRLGSWDGEIVVGSVLWARRGLLLGDQREVTLTGKALGVRRLVLNYRILRHGPIVGVDLADVVRRNAAGLVGMEGLLVAGVLRACGVRPEVARAGSEFILHSKSGKPTHPPPGSVRLVESPRQQAALLGEGI